MKEVVVNKKDIVSYWAIIKLSNPPMLTFLLKNGNTVCGFCDEGTLPDKFWQCDKPEPFTGYFPDRTFGRKFGEWYPISTWINR